MKGSPASGERSELPKCTCETYDPRGAIRDPDCQVHDEYGEERPQRSEPRGQQQELLPCPFCGDAAEFGDDGEGGEFVTCTNQMCLSSSQIKYPNKQDVKPLLIEVWNNRAQPQPSKGSPASGEHNTLESHMKRVLDPEGPVSPRGQQQEWTVEADEFAHDWIRTSDGEHMSSLPRIATAHNAAIAAERERHKTAYLSFRQRLNAFEQQLAAERQANRGLYIESNERYQQLLSALAAIEKLPDRYAEHLSAAATVGELGDVDEKYQVDLLRSVISDIDLSALHEHDAKVREPLVAALRNLANCPTVKGLSARILHDAEDRGVPSELQSALDALAKVKEQ